MENEDFCNWLTGATDLLEGGIKKKIVSYLRIIAGLNVHALKMVQEAQNVFQNITVAACVLLMPDNRFQIQQCSFSARVRYQPD